MITITSPSPRKKEAVQKTRTQLTFVDEDSIKSPRDTSGTASRDLSTRRTNPLKSPASYFKEYHNKIMVTEES